MVSLSSAECELYAAVNTTSEGSGLLCAAKDLGIACGSNLHLDATMCSVNRPGLGKAKHVDMHKSKRFVTKVVGTNANPADLMTKPLLGPKIVQLMKIMGSEFVGQSSRQEELYGMRLVGGLTDVKENSWSSAAATAK